MIRLEAGAAQAVIDPDLGAGVVTLEAGGVPVLSGGAGRVPGPFAQGLNLLVPFSNRISRPFDFGGQEHPIPANLPGEPYAIHGDAFQKAWTVTAQGESDATMTLRGGIGPFRYDARVTYGLQEGALSVWLEVVNRAEIALPYGGGFHPWFPRHDETLLQFQAAGYWPEDLRHLPATDAAVQTPPRLRFDLPRALPPDWINCGFSGWDGHATITQPGLTITVDAPKLSTATVYSPDAASPFFCFEPVSHPVDAHNLPGQPGLVPLAPGASLSMALLLSWQLLAPQKETYS